MDVTEYHRVRIFQQIQTGWKIILETLNHEQTQRPEELHKATEILGEWLQTEMRHFEETVKE